MAVLTLLSLENAILGKNTIDRPHCLSQHRLKGMIPCLLTPFRFEGNTVPGNGKNWN